MPSIDTAYQTLLTKLVANTSALPAERSRQLQRMQAYLDTAGNPEKSLPAAVHVTGTSGKTSTTTMTAAILRQAGLRVGLHTSPHLQVINESFVINGEMTPTSTLLDTLERILPSIERFNRATTIGPLRHFEVEVALAITLFAEADIDVAVIEVGLGGRRDATNVIDAKTAIITNVGLDHTKFLGPTIEHIAREKVGIIKPHATVVSGVTQPSVQQIVQNKADHVGARVLQLGRDYTVLVGGDPADGAAVTLPTEEQLHITARLAGPTYAHNAACAAAAARAFTDRVSTSDITQALSSSHVSGRLEVMQENPTVVLDCADNETEIRAGSQALANQYPLQDPIVVFAIREGKDVSGIAAILDQCARRIIVTGFKTAAVTSADPTRTAEIFMRHTSCAITAISDPFKAVEVAINAAKPNGLVLVTGFYLVGQLRNRWYNKTQLLSTINQSRTGANRFSDGASNSPR